MTTAEAEAIEPLRLHHKHRILCVDDDPAILTALRRVFRDEPYELITTARPDLALEWLRGGGYSLVLLDQRMPGIVGTEVASQVRALAPRTIRILLTAFPGNSLVQHSLAEDIEWLVSKPWNDAALRLTVRRLLHDRERHPRAVRTRRRPAPSPRPKSGKRPRPWGDGPMDPWARTLRRGISALSRGLGWVCGFFWMPAAGAELWNR